MTRQDIRVGLTILGVVAVLGLLIGYLVGVLTKPDAPLPRVAPDEIAAFEQAAGEGTLAAGTFSVPGYQELYVNDYADLLDAEAEARVREHLIELYENTGVEMTVLTIENMGRYGHQGAIEPFATTLFNTWGIGHSGRNDGVLVLISRFDREMRIELGKGYGSSRDDDMQRVIDFAFLPNFRQDAYQRGIERGVEETILEIAGVYPGNYEGGTLRHGWQQIWRWVRGIGEWIYALLLVPLGGFALWLRRYFRFRDRPCPNCKVAIMDRAGELADNAHLERGQIVEEDVHAVDYDVWQCPNCENVEIKRYPSWFSSYEKCARCAYKTMSSNSTTLTAATTSSTGLMQVDYHCKNCDYENSVTRVIPKVSKSSSSSGGSGGGGSFGGGSSGGGGASGSW